jgi:hypothetical protein
MPWEKKGLIYGPTGESAWARHSALTPTPVLLDDVIRVFVGFRDDNGISRIGYVDVAAENPSRVLAVADQPVLDVGIPGTFDSNGVILGDVIQAGTEWRMYYVGFQLVAGVKFLAFSGLALSNSACRKFVRHTLAPVVDRADEGIYIRAVHAIRHDAGIWRTWYSAGRSWQMLNQRPYPSYEIRYMESADGLRFPSEGLLCLAPRDPEYRIGRPRVFKQGDAYGMYFTKGDTHGGYMSGYAQSSDGRFWHRNDDAVGIALSKDSWDSRALAYATPIAVGSKRYLFYTGNDMGRDGFGYAEEV